MSAGLQQWEVIKTIRPKRRGEETVPRIESTASPKPQPVGRGRGINSSTPLSVPSDFLSAETKPKPEEPGSRLQRIASRDTHMGGEEQQMHPPKVSSSLLSKLVETYSYGIIFCVTEE